MAQGTSMTARIAPRPRNFEFTTIAMNKPISSSNATDITLNTMVVGHRLYEVVCPCR